MVQIPWGTLGRRAGLVLALAFVFCSAYVPHLDTFNDPNQGQEPPLVELGGAMLEVFTGEREPYRFPLHVDENAHWVQVASLQRHDAVKFPNPYTGQPPGGQGFTSLRGAVHEKGFHLVIAETQELTGVSFPALFEYLPAIWLTFTALAVWALIQPHPAAVPAAAFVGLIPTSVRFLGPGFLVPIGFVLAWLPVALILSEPARKRATGAVLLLAVVAWTFFIHLLGGFASVGLLLASALLAPAQERGTLVKLLLVAILPLLWLYRTFGQDIQREVALEESLPLDFTIFDHFGVWTMFVWGAGVAALVLRDPERRAGPMRAMGAFSVGALALIVGGVVFDLGRYATYARWHPPFFLAASVPAAYAVTLVAGSLRNVLARIPRPPRLTQAPALLGVVGAVVLSVALINQATAFHLSEPYYHVTDEDDWRRFQAVAEQADPTYEVFLSHPWKAPVMTAVTGMEPHAYLIPGSPPENGQDYTRFSRTGGSLEFFILNDITLVVSDRKPPIPEFVRLGDGVWGLEPDLATQIHEIRQAERRGR